MTQQCGKLIVIEGLDGSGKSTQSELIYRQMLSKNNDTKLISFPDYANPSSSLVRMYLGGEIAPTLGDISAYAASSFYAVDRYASYKMHWQKDYENGTDILATRYVSSNAIHQMIKLPESEWDSYLEWLDDYEHNKLGLPRPNDVIFLDMPRDIANRLILERYDNNSSKRDIHESDLTYLDMCQRSAEYCVKKLGWRSVTCNDGDNPLPADTIAELIMSQIKI